MIWSCRHSGWVLPSMAHSQPRGPTEAFGRRLREQLEIYSYQFKQAPNTFGKDQIALSGKVGGMKDDLCICLQLGVYWTSAEIVSKRVA